MSVKFFFDVASLPSWLLFEQLWAAEKKNLLKLSLRPVRATHIYSATGHKNPYFMIHIRNQMRDDASTYLNSLLGTNFIFPTDAERKVGRIGTIAAMRFLVNVQKSQPELLPDASRNLWRRLWIEDKEISTTEDFCEVCEQLSIPQDVAEISNRNVHDETLHQNADEAIKHGCYDVPFAVVEKDSLCTTHLRATSWPIIAGDLQLPKPFHSASSLISYDGVFC